MDSKIDLSKLACDKGSYALLLELSLTTTLAVGRLGTLQFNPGLYIYVGSAQGPGGLAARLGHHLRPAKRCHWHIDYLRSRAPVVAVWGRAATDKLSECRLADHLAGQALLKLPFKHFGSSDCRCYTHLFYWPFSGHAETPFSKFCQNGIAYLDKILPLMTRL